MPLPLSDDREPIHTRTLDITVYRRGDGLYDVDCRMIDVKPFEYSMLDATRAANEPIHDISLRLSIDKDLVVREAVAHMDQGAHGICDRITPDYGKLAGLSIGPGWIRQARERLGGIAGCTHLNEMLGQMSTAALQAMWSEREAEQLAETGRFEIDPGVVNSCHTYRQDSSYVKTYFPEHYKAEAPGG